MSARAEAVEMIRRICPAHLSADEYGRLLAEKLDAYRTEVLVKAVGRLKAISVTCTALTGPVWYGDGWNSAITVLEEIAEYQTPDDEAYPGELQMLRALALAKAAMGRGKCSREADATLDFFEPGHTYTEPGDVTDWRFRCDSITTHPGTEERTALGWRHFQGEWEPYAYGADDFEIHQIADAIGADTTTTGKDGA